MSCDLTIGRYDGDCLDSVGGIKQIYIINYTYNLKTLATITDETITAVSSQLDAFMFELRGANNIDESNTKDINAGTSIFEASGTITLKKQDNFTQGQMMLLSKGRPQVIVEGYDGSLRLFGIENGVDIAVNTASGADLNEFNGYTLTLTSKEINMAYFVDPSLLVQNSASEFYLG
jgi:hypothetical protein